jgi:hypothetical protein
MLFIGLENEQNRINAMLSTLYTKENDNRTVIFQSDYGDAVLHLV